MRQKVFLNEISLYLFMVPGWNFYPSIQMACVAYLIFDFVCLTLSSADTHGIAKYVGTYTRDTHTQAHTIDQLDWLRTSAGGRMLSDGITAVTV